MKLARVLVEVVCTNQGSDFRGIFVLADGVAISVPVVKTVVVVVAGSQSSTSGEFPGISSTSKGSEGHEQIFLLP